MAAYRPMGAGGPAGGPGMPGGVGGVGGGPGGAGQNTGAGSPVIGGGGVATSAPGGAGAAGAGANAGGATRNTNLSALQEIEEAYNKRLDMDVAQLMESFGDIIKVASDKYKLAQESYQIQGRATNIVTSAESLLAMVTELKQTLLLNDATTLAQLATQRQADLTSQKTAVKQRVMGLKEEVDKTIWELEQACYGSSGVVVDSSDV
ncbi:Mediator of RNA polymerase II transcription subunit 22 [Mortierella sp. AD032]|nr:Mediator of RNA polymerase II transcription subunit 22 [Mortierella sp. AD032]